MESEIDENPDRVRRAMRSAWISLVVGVALFVTGCTAMVSISTQPAQRLVIGVLAAGMIVFIAVQALRRKKTERREGTAPPTREAARRLPLIALGMVVLGWGFAFVWWQCLDPQPDLDTALVKALPFAVFLLGGLWDTWQLRREMKRGV